MEKKYCFECGWCKYKDCDFKKRAEKVARSSKLSSDKHAEIANLREKARSYSCPYLNDVDPDYVGKNEL